MTRKDSVRHAATTTKDSVRHAAEAMAPYAGTAKDAAAQYADEARRLVVPRVSAAADAARDSAVAQYDAVLAPRLAHARDAVPPKVVATTAAAAQHTRRAARKAARYTAPRVEHAVESALAAAEPVREEALARAGAAMAALRGQVSAAEVEKLVKRHQRRGRVGRVAKGVLVLGAIAGAGVAAYRWWSRQANPEWLVEAPSATEPSEAERAQRASVNGRGPLGSVVDGSDLDEDVRAKRDDDAADTPKRHNGRRGSGH